MIYSCANFHSLDKTNQNYIKIPAHIQSFRKTHRISKQTLDDHDARLREQNEKRTDTGSKEDPSKDGKTDNMDILQDIRLLAPQTE